MGEGERRRYHIPCAYDGSDVRSRTKKGWRVGQREQGMETGVALRTEKLKGCWRYSNEWQKV